jgi:septal ring factor EnvC (AmiA/AmiB activator)
MSDEADDVMTQNLRQIQATLAEHTRMLTRLTDDVGTIKERMTRAERSLDRLEAAVHSLHTRLGSVVRSWEADFARRNTSPEDGPKLS